MERLSFISFLKLSSLSWGEEIRISGRQSNVNMCHIPHHGAGAMGLGSRLRESPSPYPAPWSSCPRGLKPTSRLCPGPSTQRYGYLKTLAWPRCRCLWGMWVATETAVAGSTPWDENKEGREGGMPWCRASNPLLPRPSVGLWIRTWPFRFFWGFIYWNRRLEPILFRSLLTWFITYKYLNI